MFNFFKQLGKGILYVILLPVIILILAIFAVYGSFVIIYIFIKQVFLFFSGRSLKDPLPEDVEAQRRMHNYENNVTPQPQSSPTQNIFIQLPHGGGTPYIQPGAPQVSQQNIPTVDAYGRPIANQSSPLLDQYGRPIGMGVTPQLDQYGQPLPYDQQNSCPNVPYIQPSTMQKSTPQNPYGNIKEIPEDEKKGDNGDE